MVSCCHLGLKVDARQNFLDFQRDMKYAGSFFSKMKENEEEENQSSSSTSMASKSASSTSMASSSVDSFSSVTSGVQGELSLDDDAGGAAGADGVEVVHPADPAVGELSLEDDPSAPGSQEV